MRILSNVDISGSVGMASTGIDNFTIGTELENNNALVDNLTVNANANFKNNVILGSSSVDTVTANAVVTASSGLYVSSSLSVTGTITLNNLPVLGVQASGSATPIKAIVSIKESDYNALISPDPNTLYFILAGV